MTQDVVERLIKIADAARRPDGSESPLSEQLREAATEITRLRSLSSSSPTGQATGMTDAQIKHMVDRFLAWKLPKTFCPDGGISFDPIYNKGTPYEGKHEPVGTNVFTAIQAGSMVRHMIEGMPSSDDYKRGQRDALSAVLSLNPAAAAKVAHWAEKEPDPEGRFPFDVALWVSVVAEQLGFETLEGDGPDRFKAASPTGQDDRDAIIEMCAQMADDGQMPDSDGVVTNDWWEGYNSGRADAAQLLRSLKSPSHQTGEDR